MSTRLRRSLIWHAMAIAVLVSQPLAADGKWWEKDPVVEMTCFETYPSQIEEFCKAGDVLPFIDKSIVPTVCDYRYSITPRSNDRASCVYLGHNRIERRP